VSSFIGKLARLSIHGGRIVSSACLHIIFGVCEMVPYGFRMGCKHMNEQSLALLVTHFAEREYFDGRALYE
jgi:hypothetical protein